MKLKLPISKEQKAFVKRMERIEKEESQKKREEAIEAYFKKEEIK